MPRDKISGRYLPGDAPFDKREYARKYARKNARAFWARNIKKKYGLTADEYEAQLNVQGGGCYVCGRVTERRLAVDHNHKTGVVRKLLCAHCNNAVGVLEDANFSRWVAYLKEHDA